MNTATKEYPADDLRVSDAEREHALRELSEAFQTGRITADEFDQRSGQALEARTGKELTVLVADLPSAGRAALEPTRRQWAARIAAGASGVAATSLTAVAITGALSLNHGPDLQQREAKRALAQGVLARMGLKVPVPLPPAQGLDWASVVTPAIFAVLLFVLMIVLLGVARTGRRQGPVRP
jgi:Domain of unknown function (DUF1707)